MGVGRLGEKLWNKDDQVWNVDGEPISYRVSWTSSTDQQDRTRDFDDIDNGYDFYQDCLKDAGCLNVTWAHV